MAVTPPLTICSGIPPLLQNNGQPIRRRLEAHGGTMGKAAQGARSSKSLGGTHTSNSSTCISKPHGGVHSPRGCYTTHRRAVVMLFKIESCTFKICSLYWSDYGLLEFPQLSKAELFLTVEMSCFAARNQHVDTDPGMVQVIFNREKNFLVRVHIWRRRCVLPLLFHFREWRVIPIARKGIFNSLFLSQS